MSFGLKNSSATYQRVMNHILEPCKKYASSFIDDVAVFSKLLDSHLEHLDSTLSHIEESGMIWKRSFTEKGLNLDIAMLSADWCLQQQVKQMMTLATIRVLISYNTFDVLWNFCKESVMFLISQKHLCLSKMKVINIQSFVQPKLPLFKSYFILYKCI